MKITVSLSLKAMKVSAIVLSLVFVVVPAAHAVTVQWNEDSYSAFDVTISGTGLNWDGTITSPSGLWNLDSENRARYVPDVYPDGPIEMSTAGQLTFLGQIPPNLRGDVTMSTPHYNDSFPLSVPLRSGVTWAGLTFDGNQQYWRGVNSLVITSIPTLDDTSTWTWAAEYTASGSSLKPVPESGSGAASLALAALLIFVARATCHTSERCQARCGSSM